MNKKLALGLLSASTLLIAACSNNGSDDSQGSGEEGTTLNVYSNSLARGRQEWIEEQAAEEGFNLSFVDAGGGDILNRALAEAGSPQADIIFGLDESMFFELKGEDMFVEHVPEWADEIPEDALVGDGYFHPLIEQRIFMIANEEYTDADEISNWQDLAENVEGQYRVPSDTGGGTDQKAMLSILLQYVDEENGELGIAQEGWDELKAFFENGYTVPESEDFHELFNDGDLVINYFYSGGIEEAEENYGFKATPINPEQGVITMREQIGAVNKGDDHNYDEAKRFIDWFGSAEVQSGFVEEFGGLPVNEEAYDSAPERIQEVVEQTEPMDVDWEFVQANLSDWMEKIELEIIQ